jgi:hypothetical protein
VLGKYEVGYLACETCKSLQTDFPHWIEEAYSQSAVPLDPGAVQRCLDCFALTLIVSRVLNCRRMLDYGGGNGLVCRLLRDHGEDAYWFDRYSRAGYASGFSASPSSAFDLVTVFEVLEHFPNPAADLSEIFLGKPRCVLATSALYCGQNEDWWYLAPTEGQHLFFYSKEAINRIGVRFGYESLVCRGFFIFSRQPLTAWERFILQRVVGPRIIRLKRFIALGKRTSAPQRDFDLIISRVDGKAESD